jgi:hypothetical protein
MKKVPDLILNKYNPFTRSHWEVQRKL